jgi:hypothetical protein
VVVLGEREVRRHAGEVDLAHGGHLLSLGSVGVKRCQETPLWTTIVSVTVSRKWEWCGMKADVVCAT